MHALPRVSEFSVGLIRRVLLGFVVAATPVFATDLNVSGNLTVTGTVSSGGAIDSDSNSQSFGAQSTSTPTVPGSVFTYADDSLPTGSIDSFKSLVNRSAASWLWFNGPSGGPFVNAMRLDDAHQLLLFKSDGTTAGLTFTPQTYTIKLGTHASATLTGNTSTGLITAGGGLTVTGPLTVSGGITNNTGSFGGEPKFDNIPYTPTTALSPTTGSGSFAWGGVYTGTLTGNLTITSFSGTEAAGKKVRFILVCSGSQSLTFPASYRAGQTNATTTTFTPAAGRHVLLFESLDGAGLFLLTDTVFGQLDATSVAVAATPAHYSAASANVEAHLAGIDTALASAGSASVSDTAYNATSWDGVTTVAPSKNAVRDRLEAIASAATVPPQMGNFWSTADLASKPAGWLVAGEGGTPAAATVGGYTMIVKSNGDVAAPTFSPVAGTYSSTQSVTLSTATSGASIRYTTNGVDPTRSSGTVYSSPVSVSATSTIKAIAYKDYWADSAVQSAAYVILSPPTLSSATINTAGSTMTLAFSESVSVGAGGNSGWTTSLSGGAATLSYASGSPGTSLVYNISRTINSGETGTVAYTQPGNGVEGTTGGADVATISSSAVTNNSTAVSYTATDATGGVLNSGISTQYDDGLTSNFVAGSSYTLTKAQLKLKKSGTGGGGTIVVKIYTDSSGAPGTLLGTSDSVAVSTLTGTPTFTDFTGLNVSITSGTTYWVAFLQSTTGGGTGSSTNTVSVDYNDNTGRTLRASSNAGSTWTDVNLSNIQIVFQLFKSP